MNPQTNKEEKKPVDAKLIADNIFKAKKNYQEANQAQRAEFDEIYAAYKGELEDSTDKSKSQEKIKKMMTEVNYIVPSIFSGSPEFEVDIIGDEDKDLAFVGEKIINHRLNTIKQAYEKIEAWVKQSVVFGTSIIKLCWDVKLEENEDGTKRVAVDEPNLEVPNIKDCFYNPIIPEIECQKPIFRSVLPIEEVKENTIYDFTDELGNLNREKVESKGNSSSNNYDSSNQAQGDQMDSSKIGDGTIEIFEQISEDKIETVADGKERLVLRSRPNPYKFVTAVKLVHEPTAIPNRFEGVGVGHETLGFSKLIQKLSNRLTDAVNLGNNPHFLVDKGAGLDKRQLVIRPGGATEIDAEGGSIQNKIVPLEVPDIKNGALELLNRFDEDHKRASGANDMLQGAASNNTLGQDQMAATYSSSRFELITRRFKQALSDVGRMLLLMEIQNIQSIDASILKIFPLNAELAALQAKNPGAKLISREYAYALLLAAREKGSINWDVQVKGETTVARNKAMEVKQATDMFNLFAPLLPPKYQFAWMRKIAEKGGMDGIDELIPDEEFLQAQQGQEMQPQEQVAMQPQMMDQSQMGQQMINQPSPLQ